MKRIINTHNCRPYLQELARLADNPISWDATYKNSHYLNTMCQLEVALGHLALDTLTTLALIGRSPWQLGNLERGEGFKADGLEGKAIIQKPFRNALLNIQILEPYRWRIVVRLPSEST